MNNLREVKDDLFKEWFNFREENLLCYLNDEDKKHELKFDDISEKIIKNIPNRNKKFAKKQFEILYSDFMDNLNYLTEKYYRQGFSDVIELFFGPTDSE